MCELPNSENDSKVVFLSTTARNNPGVLITQAHVSAPSSNREGGTRGPLWTLMLTVDIWWTGSSSDSSFAQCLY